MINVQIRLEVLSARLSKGVDCCDEHWAVLAPWAGVLDVGRDVSIAAHRVGVFGRYASAGVQSTVESPSYNDHLTVAAADIQHLRSAENICMTPTTQNWGVISLWTYTLTHRIISLPTLPINFTRINSYSISVDPPVTGPEPPMDNSLDNHSDLTQRLWISWFPALGVFELLVRSLEVTITIGALRLSFEWRIKSLENTITIRPTTENNCRSVFAFVVTEERTQRGRRLRTDTLAVGSVCV